MTYRELGAVMSNLMTEEELDSDIRVCDQLEGRMITVENFVRENESLDGEAFLISED